MGLQSMLVSNEKEGLFQNSERLDAKLADGIKGVFANLWAK